MNNGMKDNDKNPWLWPTMQLFPVACILDTWQRMQSTYQLHRAVCNHPIKTTRFRKTLSFMHAFLPEVVSCRFHGGKQQGCLSFPGIDLYLKYLYRRIKLSTLRRSHVCVYPCVRACGVHSITAQCLISNVTFRRHVYTLEVRTDLLAIGVFMYVAS